MKQLNRTHFKRNHYPTKILQFGEGNFLRAFVDWQIDQLNHHNNLNAGVTVVRPIDHDTLPLLDTQDGLYTTLIRGLDETGRAIEEIRIIDCVNEEIPVTQNFDRYMALAENESIEVIFSNTTEAGIAFVETDKLDDKPATSFPAKLTQWLYKRFQHFKGAKKSGVFIIPCELIDYNGKKLKEITLRYCELWDLEDAFIHWLHTANHFCSTLVDRIVPGFPKDEVAKLQTKLGYKDQFMVTGEYFHLFVIQGPDQLKDVLHLQDCGLNIKIVDDIYPYKQRKVAILNGAHTAMVPLAYMGGFNTVGDTMADPLFFAVVKQLIFDEIIPTLNLSKEELVSFADDVIKRFKNPYIRHLLISISLNSMTKFATRIIPQLVIYAETQNRLPKLMVHALAAQILFYRGVRNDQNIPLTDDKRWLTVFAERWAQYDKGDIGERALVKTVLSAQWHWEQDLTEIPNLLEAVTNALTEFMTHGVQAVLAKHVNPTSTVA